MTALLDVKAFKGMGSAELDWIGASSRVLVPRDGARFFLEGDSADAVYAIMNGLGRQYWARISAHTRQAPSPNE